MSELPLSWTTTSLGALCGNGQYGWTTKAAGQGSAKFLRTTDITKGVIDWSSVPYCQEAPPDIDKYLVKPNDILISRAGSVGFSTLIASLPSPTVFASYLIRFVPCEHVAPKFVAYFLRSTDYWNQISNAAAGIALANVNAAKLADVEVPLAPLNEQKRIADKLDAILARVDACRERLDRVPAILKRFRQAVLAAAASGKLTEEWREEHDDRLTSKGSVVVSQEALPPSWRWSCPEEIRASERYSLAIGPFGSNLKVKDYRPTGVPLVFVKEIRTRNFGGPGTKFVSKEKAVELAAHTIAGGDLLITKMGDPPGDTALYPKDAPNAVITADCIKLRVNELVAHPVFVGLVIESPSFRKRLQEITAGIAQQKISLERFRRFPLQLAPITEQHEIVRRVEALFAYADRLEARYTAARAQVERLAPTLLAKAFRGELMPQDPNDEPASVLLERIRAARAEQPTTKRERKPPAVRVPRAPKEKAAMTKSRYDDDVQYKPYLAGLLREAGGIASVEDLFRRAELPVTDFYKQLAWEVENGHIRDDETRLEAA